MNLTLTFFNRTLLQMLRCILFLKQNSENNPGQNVKNIYSILHNMIQWKN